jgi:cobalamin biosynthesis Co2+ chelatase CbiK
MMMIHMVVVMIFITSKHVPKTMVLKDKRLWKTKLQKIGMRRKNYRNPLNLSFG